MKKPAEYLTLSSKEGETLIAQVHQSNLPAAVAERLEQIIRTCLWLVFALQETKITVKRLRSLLFGKSLKPSPIPEESSESSPEQPPPIHPLRQWELKRTGFLGPSERPMHCFLKS